MYPIEFAGSQQFEELSHSAVHPVTSGGETTQKTGLHHSLERNWLHVHCKGAQLSCGGCYI